MKFGGMVLPLVEGLEVEALLAAVEKGGERLVWVGRGSRSRIGLRRSWHGTNGFDTRDCKARPAESGVLGLAF